MLGQGSMHHQRHQAGTWIVLFELDAFEVLLQAVLVVHRKRLGGKFEKVQSSAFSSCACDSQAMPQRSHRKPLYAV